MAVQCPVRWTLDLGYWTEKGHTGDSGPALLAICL